MNDPHERLKRSSKALLVASGAYWAKAGPPDDLWHNLQQAEMAVRHALDDEEAGDGGLCPCSVCRKIGGVEPVIKLPLPEPQRGWLSSLFHRTRTVQDHGRKEKSHA